MDSKIKLAKIDNSLYGVYLKGIPKSPSWYIGDMRRENGKWGFYPDTKDSSHKHHISELLRLVKDLDSGWEVK
jgi:hypothetical protein